MVTCRRLPACAAEPQTVRVCTDPGPGVDERLNLNQRVRGPNGRPLGCVELACLWLYDRVAHQAQVRQGNARPDAFDYRAIGSPEVLHQRADQALALYVTGSSQSNFAFDVSVHLWQRRPGATSMPGVASGGTQRMNTDDWFDTYLPCCVLHVPNA